MKSFYNRVHCTGSKKYKTHSEVKSSVLANQILFSNTGIMYLKKTSKKPFSSVKMYLLYRKKTSLSKQLSRIKEEFFPKLCNSVQDVKNAKPVTPGIEAFSSHRYSSLIFSFFNCKNRHSECLYH